MRKSLSYKILAALMAAGSFGLYVATPAAAEEVKLIGSQLRANGNAIIINGNKLTTPSSTAITTLSKNVNVYGIGYNESEEANFYTAPANKGNVTITGSTFDEVYGGFTVGVNGENTTANNNTVTLNSSNISNVYGGQSISGSADTNTVTITGGKYGVIIGGWGYSDNANGSAKNNKIFISNAEIGTYKSNYIIGGSGGTANENIVTITNSIVNLSSKTDGPYYNLTGGVGYAGGAEKNHVIITDSTISGNVYGAYIYNNNGQLAIDNNITITGSSDITNANLYGYGTNSGATGSGNTLTLDGWSGFTKSVKNFNDINFDNINWQNGRTVLTITEGADNDLANTEIYLNTALRAAVKLPLAIL